MIRIVIILIFQLMLFTACAQITKNVPNVESDLNNLIPNGKNVADVLDSVKMDKRQVELTLKFQAGIKKNYQWFVDYVKGYEKGNMPYHPNMGLTKEEYDELKDLSSNIEFVSSQVDTVDITKTEELITFKSVGKLEFLKYLKIYPKKNEITLLGNLLNYSEADTIINSKNAFKSKWTGHTWRLEEPKDFDFNSLKDIKTVSLKVYKVTIGRLEKNGKTFLTVKGQEYNNGKPIVNFELPFVIN